MDRHTDQLFYGELVSISYLRNMNEGNMLFLLMSIFKIPLLNINIHVKFDKFTYH